MKEIQDFLSSAAGIATSVVTIGALLIAVARWAHAIWKKVSHIYDELTPNGGGSIKDVVNRIEALQLASLQLTGKAYWLSDPDGKCTYASTRLAALMGFHADQALGWGWVSAVALECREPVRLEWCSAVKDRREFHMKYVYVHPDGSRVPVTGHAIPVIHAQTRVVVGMIGWADPVEPIPVT